MVRTAGASALAAGSMVAFPALAFASEESSGGISAILPNMSEFIPMLVCFIILVVVLGKVGWPKFAGMIEKREKSIKDALEKSEAARIESEQLLEEYKRQLAEAKAQAAQIVADARKTGEAVKADLTEKAQAESAAMIEKARLAIEAEKKAAISELQGSVADISIAVASRVIGNDLSDDEHRAIVERYVKEAGSFNAN
ncbi:MAG: F0F1 ATP synthase subunit B [Eggerthellaceae bacterium]|nr:F0F1 ATP synthase subunit B [Eggerthellaceae bacterium]